MPKGALLHTHFDATLSQEGLIDIALTYPNVCISFPSLLTPEKLSTLDIPYLLATDVPFTFKVFPPSSPYLSSFSGDIRKVEWDVSSPSYSPGSFIPLKLAQQCFGGGGKEDAFCIEMKTRASQTDLRFSISLGKKMSCGISSTTSKISLWFKNTVKEAKLDIPLILHAGETKGDGDASDQNLYDALLLGSKRIGHGTSLVKHPVLMQMVKDKDILLEVCPISNEVLRFSGTVPTHPYPILFNHGIKCALSSDDGGQIQNVGLSFDFYQVLQGSRQTDLFALKKLARQSIEYSELNEENKAGCLASFEKRFELYLEEILRFGEQLGELKIVDEGPIRGSYHNKAASDYVVGLKSSN
ncbi:Metallo-dependent hydrolase [Atractiella rhizophila]|nr:Metallo-dependent hydrolase [Atractiella rhizophila]